MPPLPRGRWECRCSAFVGEVTGAAQHEPVPPLPSEYLVGGVSSRMVELPATLIVAGLPPPKNLLMRLVTIGTPVQIDP